MEDKKPFINVTETGHNFTMEDCEFVGDRPTIKTAATNTRLVRVKHFGQKIKEHPIMTLIIIGIVAAVIAGIILLKVEYGFFK